MHTFHSVIEWAQLNIKWKCYSIIYSFLSLKMCSLSENEKAFLLFHFNFPNSIFILILSTNERPFKRKGKFKWSFFYHFNSVIDSAPVNVKCKSYCILHLFLSQKLLACLENEKAILLFQFNLQNSNFILILSTY